MAWNIKNHHHPVEASNLGILTINKYDRASFIVSDSQLKWADEPGYMYGAAGKRDVLFLVSYVSTTDNPDIVPRRSRGPLTEEERRKLEEQGIHNFDNDLTIMRARGKRDNRFTLH